MHLHKSNHRFEKLPFIYLLSRVLAHLLYRFSINKQQNIRFWDIFVVLLLNFTLTDNMYFIASSCLLPVHIYTCTSHHQRPGKLTEMWVWQSESIALRLVRSCTLCYMHVVWIFVLSIVGFSSTNKPYQEPTIQIVLSYWPWLQNGVPSFSKWKVPRVKRT